MSLHSKIQLANIVKKNSELLGAHFPKSLILDNETDTKELKLLLASPEVENKLILKSDSVGQEGLTDQVHILDKWLREFWLEKLTEEKEPWKLDIVKQNLF